MPNQISPKAFRAKLQNLLQSGKIPKKTTELILKDQGQEVKNLKQTEFEYGLRPDGSKIGTYKGKSYAKRKHILNPLAGVGVVDLTLTGASNRSLFIHQKAGGFVVDANTPQWGYNLTRYGSEIESVNQSAFEKIQAKRDAPILVKYINEQLQIQ